MKIRPKISKFLQGGVPQWYLNLYNQHALGNWNNTLRYDYADLNLNSNDHYNAANLETVYRKQNAYTMTPSVVGQDILSFYNTDGGNMTAEEFVNFYNLNAEKIRNHWASDLTYNASTAGDHNRLYRRMFLNRSNTSLSPGSEYNIGYQEGVTKGGYDIQDIEGSSTWLRRMDRYEHEFDPNNPDLNRLHEITLKDGSKAVVYKKANGDIGLLSSTPANPATPANPQNPNTPPPPLEPQNPQDPNNPQGKVPARHGLYGIKWDFSKLGIGLQRALPGILEIGRLAGTLNNNARVFDDKLKGIRPDLLLTYLTHRQVVGDEATKLAFYRRAAQGQTKAGRAFTSDADRQMAYLMEAKRAGDELRAQGDLADNQEIRRTSDESNQHQWANTQRRTDVANYNTKAINFANAQKQDLKAQRHAADWTSINNWLLGIETRQRLKQAENKAIQDLIFALDELQRIANDPEYTDLRLKYSDAWDAALKAGKNPASDPAVLAARRAYEAKQYQLKRLQLESLQRHSNEYWWAKNGIKLNYKKKDDLLYKTARDAVDHFRKMTKMTDESTRRSRTKQVRLAPHPGGTRSYQQGGVAPFAVFTPAVLGGESGMQTAAGIDSSLGGKRGSGSGSSKSEKDPKLDVIKDLFSKLEGLPSDVNGVYTQMSNFLAKAQAFGDEITTDDLASIYLLLLQQINNIKFSKSAYDEAKKQATENDALNEFAVDLAGRVAALTSDGKIRFTTWDEIKKSKDLNPLTNNDLLNLRAYSNDLTFNDGIFNIVNNGIGITKIAEFIKANLPSFGNSEETLEGFTKHETDQIKTGLELLKEHPDLLKEAPSGDYKVSKYTKTLKDQATMALKYIASILPTNMKAILNIHADILGTTTGDILTSLISSKVDYASKLELTPLTGKAAKDSNGGGDKGASGGLKLDAATALISGKGYQSVIEFNPGTSYAVSVTARHTAFLKKSGDNMGSGITMKEATTSTLSLVLDWNKATLGGSKINPTSYDKVLINNGDVVGVDLPIGEDKNTPDFSMLKKLLTLDLELLKQGIEDKPENALKINLLCKQFGLPDKYKQDGSLNDTQWNRFAAFLVTADDSVLSNKSVILDDIIGIVDDDNVRDEYELIIKKDNKDYSLGSGIFGIGKLALYLGTVFVPIKSNYVGSALSGGQDIYMTLATDLELLEQGYDKAKIALYKLPTITLD